MIQRKQTVFLLLAVIITVVCLCLPLCGFSSEQGIFGESVMYNLWIVTPDGTHDLSVWALFAILLVTCPIALFAVFSFHNRVLQWRLCVFNILLILGWYIVFACFVIGKRNGIGSSDIYLTSVLPLISGVLYFMARKAILADEALIRSSERIR